MRITAADDKAIELVLGDTTAEETDAIVNAANSTLMGGGGVDGAIHRAGGAAILEECKAIRARSGMPPPGQAVATTGGRLKAKHVIHTVGPIHEDGPQGEAETLASCYRESIRSAEQMGLSSVAFPAISTGIFGYPVGPAAAVALDATRHEPAIAKNMRLVRFVLFGDDTFAAFRRAATAQP